MHVTRDNAHWRDIKGDEANLPPLLNSPLIGCLVRYQFVDSAVDFLVEYQLVDSQTKQKQSWRSDWVGFLQSSAVVSKQCE